MCATVRRFRSDRRIVFFFFFSGFPYRRECDDVQKRLFDVDGRDRYASSRKTFEKKNENRSRFGDAVRADRVLSRNPMCFRVFRKNNVFRWNARRFGLAGSVRATCARARPCRALWKRFKARAYVAARLLLRKTFIGSYRKPVCAPVPAITVRDIIGDTPIRCVATVSAWVRPNRCMIISVLFGLTFRKLVSSAITLNIRCVNRLNGSTSPRQRNKVKVTHGAASAAWNVFNVKT